MMQTEVGRELVSSLADQDDRGEMDRRDIILSNGLRSYEDMGTHQQLIGNRTIGRDRDAASIEGAGTASAVFLTNQDRALEDREGNKLPMSADTVMFHELTHAKHNLDGTRDEGHVEAEHGVPSDTGRKWSEEHHTVGIGEHEGEWYSENTYREQKRTNASAMEDSDREAVEAQYAEREQYAAKPTSRVVTDTSGMRQYGEGGWPTS
jgi:hypothetical protein